MVLDSAVWAGLVLGGDGVTQAVIISILAILVGAVIYANLRW